MKPLERAMLFALLSRSPNAEPLLPFLPKEATNNLSSNLTPVDFPSLLSGSHWLKSIHYSWLVDFLKKIPQEGQEIFLSLFTPHQVKGLQKLLQLAPKGPLPPLPPFVRLFLFHTLKEKVYLNQESTLILQQRNSFLNALLFLPKPDLMILIDFLGLYDLAVDFKQIVDKELIKRIQNVLTSQQFSFLQFCLKQPIKWVPPKLNLPTWNGEKVALNTLLHKRGLIRFSHALRGEDPAFQRAILHHLDTGRAKIIHKVLTQKMDTHLPAYFKHQVLDIVKRYFKK